MMQRFQQARCCSLKIDEENGMRVEKKERLRIWRKRSKGTEEKRQTGDLSHWGCCFLDT